ncbi:MAG: DUF1501 domain-containing protein [Fimbriiglobus sp.]|jgi:hypothetical protein|nr:DUF1501 domain-containing protein [Fimbriiglobus sp.]
MLNLFGRPARYCDGITRRSALRIGTFAFGATAFTLADVFRAEAAAKKAESGPTPTQHKAVINIFLGGGPPHQDMWDIKTEAPSEIRGEFKPINTAVSGIQIGETFPKIAAMMDKFAVIRSIVGARGGHDAIQCTTGWPENSLAPMGGRPSIGSFLAKVAGAVDPSVPPYIGLSDKTQHAPWSDPGRSGFLGSTFGAFTPNGPDLANMKMIAANKASLSDRKKLLAAFDDLKREADAGGQLRAADAHTQRAFDVLTSSKLMDALDLSKEDPKVRDRYGDGKPYQYQYDGAPTANDQLLMARRLVQAGARCVTLSFGRWDSHGKNFDLVRDHGTKLDQALTALVWDLERLDILNDVTVIAWGEFGRTPQINKDAGRDHWPQVSCAILAGGGLKTGQVIGSTDRTGGNAKDRPVTFGEVFATLYHAVGLNPETTTVMDPTGRPQYPADGAVMKELV